MLQKFKIKVLNWVNLKAIPERRVREIHSSISFPVGFFRRTSLSFVRSKRDPEILGQEFDTWQSMRRRHWGKRRESLRRFFLFALKWAAWTSRWALSGSSCLGACRAAAECTMFAASSRRARCCSTFGDHWRGRIRGGDFGHRARKCSRRTASFACSQSGPNRTRTRIRVLQYYFYWQKLMLLHRDSGRPLKRLNLRVAFKYLQKGRRIGRGEMRWEPFWSKRRRLNFIAHFQRFEEIPSTFSFSLGDSLKSADLLGKKYPAWERAEDSRSWKTPAWNIGSENHLRSEAEIYLNCEKRNFIEHFKNRLSCLSDELYTKKEKNSDAEEMKRNGV